MTIPNQAPSGGFGGAKERSRSDSARRPGSPGHQSDSKEYCAAVLPPTRPFDLRPDPKKQTLKEVGVLVLPQLRGFGGVSPRFEVQTSMRSREAWTEPKKDGEMVPQVSPIELSPNRKHWVHDPSREHPNVERIPEVTPHRVQPHGGTSGDQLPDRTDP